MNPQEEKKMCTKELKIFNSFDQIFFICVSTLKGMMKDNKKYKCRVIF